MANEENRLEQQGRRAKPGPYLTKKKKSKAGLGSLPEKKEKFPFIKKEDGQKILIMVDETQKMAKGGRAMLRGGGICKKGMNKKAVGKNS